MFAKVGPRAEPMATPSTWPSNKIIFSFVVNERLSKMYCLLRPETIWLVLNNSLTHISILSSSGTFAKRESTSREAMYNLEFCFREFKRVLDGVIVGSKLFK